MIDFRYHLVSIISIFLALAVGIVLGAGPLKGGIGTTLTQELANARADKAALNDDLTAARRQQAASNSFASAVLPGVVDEALSGRDVLVVTGPRAGDALVRGVEDAVEQAGGTVSKRVALSNAFLSTTDATARTATIDRLAPALAVGDRNPAERPGAVLARGLTEGASGAPGYSPTTGATVMAALTAAKLVSSKEPQPGTEGTTVPTLVVVVPGPLPTDAAEAKAHTEAYLGLARGIDSVAAGTLLVSDVATAAAPTAAAKVVSAARASNLTSEAVSTVDDVDLPMGQAAVALALAQEAVGSVGRYGVQDDAQAVIPALPAARATGSPSPTASRS